MAPSKTLLITGFSDGGLGSALAVRFQAKGWRVFATARDTLKMSAFSILPNTTSLTLDITIKSTIEAVVKMSKSEGIALDVLINNAGRNHLSSVLDIDIEEAKKIYDSNLWGPRALIQALSPFLIQSKGTIVNTTSISGYVNVPYIGLYAASKRALEILKQGQTYFEDWKLPTDSIYKPIENIIAQRARGIDGVKREDTETYASNAVDDIISGATGKVWRRGGAGGTKFGTTCMPQGMMDSMVSKGTGLDQLPQV